jgi:protein-tyrosine phosphatase
MIGMMKQLYRTVLQLHHQGPRLATLALVDKVGRAVTGGPVERFSYIAPYLIIGGQPARRRWKKMFASGVKGVINLRDEYNYELKVKFGDIKYLYLPTIDNEAPAAHHLADGVSFIREIIREEGKIYIHCWEGLGRGPTMAAAYLISTGMTPEEAWTEIRKVRPFIRPTRKQIEQLEIFARTFAETSPETGSYSS